MKMYIGFKKRIKRTVTRLLFPEKKDVIIVKLTRQLEGANKKFEILSKAINDAIWDWNQIDDSVQWSHALFSIYGYDEKSRPNTFKGWAANIHPDERQEVLNQINDAVMRGKPNWNSIYRYKCLNGNYKYTFDRGYVVYEGSKPVRMIGAMQDIDERMIALREIEKLSLVASKTDNLVIITDAEEKIEWVNEGFIKKTGYSLREIIGQTPRFLQGAETERSSLDRIHKSIVAGQSVTEEVLNYTKDGSKFWLKININPVFDESEKLVKFVAVETDVTLHKEYERKITAIARDLTNLIATANAPIFGIDRNGFINEWNNRASEITGFRKSEIFSQKLIDALVQEESRTIIQEKLDQVYKGTPLSNLELPIITKEGKKVIILLNATARKNSNDVIESLFLVGQDITELTQYRQSLEEKVKERTLELQAALKKEKELATIKSRFASMVSHEFRTPLSTIRLSAGHVKKYKERMKPEEIDKKIEAIQDQVTHMTHLLEDVLTIGKSEEGKIDISKRKLNISDLITNIKQEVENQFKNTHAIHCSLEFADTEIYSDDDLLRNIFINLLSNAIKFSPGRSEVFVRGYEKNACIVFEIQDKGIGIPDADSERIFLPFDRGANASAIPGTGLGLSIVKKAIDLIGGHISLNSQQGIGTTFSITIPNEH